MKERIVVKIGSNVLTTPEGKLDITRMSALVDQVSWLRRKDYDVVIVSSGAVACGRKELPVNEALDNVAQRQLYSAMGQVKLVNLYYDLFREYGLHIGQVLATKDNFSTPTSLENLQACMEVMIGHGVIPIVNENDTVSIQGLMFTDNDELSGLIARMVKAKQLILLTNVDGVYTGHPDDKGSKLIGSVAPGDDLSRYITSEKSKSGRGGMKSKYGTACNVAAQGIRVIIANGERTDILPLLIQTPTEVPHTEFIPSL